MALRYLKQLFIPLILLVWSTTYAVPTESEDGLVAENIHPRQDSQADTNFANGILEHDREKNDVQSEGLTSSGGNEILKEQAPTVTNTAAETFNCAPTYSINVQPAACNCDGDNVIRELKEQVEWLTTAVKNLQSGENYQRTDSKVPTGDSIKPKDCADLFNNGYVTSDVYTIQPKDGKGSIEVYCDMETDGGGWTVFQRRQDGSVNFYRDWDGYKFGFGEMLGEFWLGNGKIHRLSVQDRYDIRIDMIDTNGNTAYAVYDDFGVASEKVKYKLSLGEYHGTAGDSLGTERHRNMAFSTRDQDNDEYDGNCAKTYKGGWWYGACHHVNLNGLYHHGDNPTESGDGISWQAWRGFHYSVKYTDMKIRPHNFDLLQ
ncbi:techylectin-5A-like [Glandiceps talaboti]